MLFSIPHFSGETNAGIMVDNKTDDNICRLVSVRESDMGLGRIGQHISKLSNPALGTPNNLRFVHVSLLVFNWWSSVIYIICQHSKKKTVSDFSCLELYILQRKQLLGK